jgi:hypothetical protein
MARCVIDLTALPTPASSAKLVDAFLPDHGAVHVGQQHLLAPPFGGLGHHVHALGLQAVPDAVRFFGSRATSNSAAWLGSSQTASPPPIAFRRFETSAGSRYIAGLVMSVTVNIRALSALVTRHKARDNRKDQCRSAWQRAREG